MDFPITKVENVEGAVSLTEFEQIRPLEMGGTGADNNINASANLEALFLGVLRNSEFSIPAGADLNNYLNAGTF